MKKFSIILAVDNENGIGKCWDLAWYIPEDMKYFKDTTTKTKSEKKQNALIMWRKTWESIPEKYRPFKNRKNFILSRNYENMTMNEQWAYQFSNIDACLEFIESQQDIEEVFVIWGSQIYNQCLTHPQFKTAYITRIYEKYHCDVFFDGLPSWFELRTRSKKKQHEGVEFEFSVYKKKITFLEKIRTFFKNK